MASSQSRPMRLAKLIATGLLNPDSREDREIAAAVEYTANHTGTTPGLSLSAVAAGEKDRKRKRIADTEDESAKCGALDPTDPVGGQIVGSDAASTTSQKSRGRKKAKAVGLFHDAAQLNAKIALNEQQNKPIVHATAKAAAKRPGSSRARSLLAAAASASSPTISASVSPSRPVIRPPPRFTDPADGPHEEEAGLGRGSAVAREASGPSREEERTITADRQLSAASHRAGTGAEAASDALSVASTSTRDTRASRASSRARAGAVAIAPAPLKQQLSPVSRSSAGSRGSADVAASVFAALSRASESASDRRAVQAEASAGSYTPALTVTAGTPNPAGTPLHHAVAAGASSSSSSMPHPGSGPRSAGQGRIGGIVIGRGAVIGGAVKTMSGSRRAAAAVAAALAVSATATKAPNPAVSFTAQSSSSSSSSAAPTPLRPYEVRDVAMALRLGDTPLQGPGRDRDGVEEGGNGSFVVDPYSQCMADEGGEVIAGVGVGTGTVADDSYHAFGAPDPYSQQVEDTAFTAPDPFSQQVDQSAWDMGDGTACDADMSSASATGTGIAGLSPILPRGQGVQGPLPLPIAKSIGTPVNFTPAASSDAGSGSRTGPMSGRVFSTARTACSTGTEAGEDGDGEMEVEQGDGAARLADHPEPNPHASNKAGDVDLGGAGAGGHSNEGNSLLSRVGRLVGLSEESVGLVVSTVALASLPPAPPTLRYYASQHAASYPCEDGMWVGCSTGAGVGVGGEVGSHLPSRSSASGARAAAESSCASAVSEDGSYVFVLFDGHGGPDMVSFGLRNLPRSIQMHTAAAGTVADVVAGLKAAFDACDQAFLQDHIVPVYREAKRVHALWVAAGSPQYGKLKTEHDVSTRLMGGRGLAGACTQVVLLRRVALTQEGTVPGERRQRRWVMFTANAGDCRAVLGTTLSSAASPARQAGAARAMDLLQPRGAGLQPAQPAHPAHESSAAAAELFVHTKDRASLMPDGCTLWPDACYVPELLSLASGVGAPQSGKASPGSSAVPGPFGYVHGTSAVRIEQQNAAQFGKEPLSGSLLTETAVLFSADEVSRRLASETGAGAETSATGLILRHAADPTAPTGMKDIVPALQNSDDLAALVRLRAEAMQGVADLLGRVGRLDALAEQAFMHWPGSCRRPADIAGWNQLSERDRPGASSLLTLLSSRRSVLVESRALALPLSRDHSPYLPAEYRAVLSRSKEPVPMRRNRRAAVAADLVDRNTLAPGAQYKRHGKPMTPAEVGTWKSSHVHPDPGHFGGPLAGVMLRVGGSLAVTRALGDWYLKLPGVVDKMLGPGGTEDEGCPYLTCEPEVNWHVLQTGDRFLIMACDGIWDVLRPAEAVELVAAGVAEDTLAGAAEARGQGKEGAMAIRTLHDALASGAFTGHFGLQVPERGVCSIHPPWSRGTNHSPSSLPPLASMDSCFIPPVIAASLNRVQDAVLGNPAQRLVGTAILGYNAGGRTGNKSSRLWDVAPARLGRLFSEVTALKAKGGLGSHLGSRRAKHDDSTALVILLPSYMLDENSQDEADMRGMSADGGHDGGIVTGRHRQQGQVDGDIITLGTVSRSIAGPTGNSVAAPVHVPVMRGLDEAVHLPLTDQWLAIQGRATGDAEEGIPGYVHFDFSKSHGRAEMILEQAAESGAALGVAAAHAGGGGGGGGSHGAGLVRAGDNGSLLATLGMSSSQGGTGVHGSIRSALLLERSRQASTGIGIGASPSGPYVRSHASPGPSLAQTQARPLLHQAGGEGGGGGEGMSASLTSGGLLAFFKPLRTPMQEGPPDK